ncbi:hypothetical protein EI94DRAFT_1703631 [Lactarius quietus]|nr:hypothetical protein EI94DRAFT_1703631 [Lactarius quietus]
MDRRVATLYLHKYEGSYHVQLTVFDWDKLSANDYVGDVEIETADLAMNVPKKDLDTELHPEDEDGSCTCQQFSLLLETMKEAAQGSKQTATLTYSIYDHFTITSRQLELLADILMSPVNNYYQGQKCQKLQLQRLPNDCLKRQQEKWPVELVGVTSVHRKCERQKKEDEGRWEYDREMFDQVQAALAAPISLATPTIHEYSTIPEPDTYLSRTYTSAHDKPMNLKSVQGSMHTKPGKQSIGPVELAKTMHVKGLNNPYLPIQERFGLELGLTKRKMT